MNRKHILVIVIATSSALMGAYIGSMKARASVLATQYEFAAARDQQEWDRQELMEQRLHVEVKLRRLIDRDPHNQAITSVLDDLKKFDMVAVGHGVEANRKADAIIRQAKKRVLSAHIQLCDEGIPYPRDVLYAYSTSAP